MADLGNLVEQDKPRVSIAALIAIAITAIVAGVVIAILIRARWLTQKKRLQSATRRDVKAFDLEQTKRMVR